MFLLRRGAILIKLKITILKMIHASLITNVLLIPVHLYSNNF